VVEQDRDEFEYLLRTALAINPDFMTAWRMNNLVSQRRARWLLDRTDLLFLN
jgi:predicted anti-sigma-YlaC factor YlaD